MNINKKFINNVPIPKFFKNNKEAPKGGTLLPPLVYNILNYQYIYLILLIFIFIFYKNNISKNLISQKNN